MKTLNRITWIVALAFVIMGQRAALAADTAAGQLLFVSGAVKIVDAFGVERTARKGDRIGPEEHVVTGAGAIGQIKLPDGSLIGVRPDSDLMLDKPRSGNGPDERVVYLSKGAVRIVNVEGGKDKPLPVLLQTPTASIGLRNADNESIVVPTRAAGSANPPVDAGTYSRMTMGSGVLRTNAGETPLAPSQTGFAPTGGNAPPTKIVALPDMGGRANPPGAIGGVPATGRTAAPATGPMALGPLAGVGGGPPKIPGPPMPPMMIAPPLPAGAGPGKFLPVKPPTVKPPR